MIDNEIIKWLQDEIHLAEYVDSDYRDGIKVDYIKSNLDLINRQKAEIAKKDKALEIADKMQKGLNKEIARLHKLVDKLRTANVNAYGYGYGIGYAKAKKEFADRLYKKLGVTKNYAIDEVLREMVGDDNA